MPKTVKSRHFCLYLFIMMCVNTNGFAQIDMGVLGGTNFSTIISEPEGLLIISHKNYLGIGFTTGYPVYKDLSIHLDIRYLGKGAPFKIAGQDQINANFDLEYLDMLFKMCYTIPMPVVEPYVCAGFFIEHNLSAQLQYTGPGFTDVQDVTDNLLSYNYGYVFGCGLQKLFGKFIVFTECYYSKGLPDLYDIENYSESTLSTEGVQAYLGTKMTFNLWE